MAIHYKMAGEGETLTVKAWGFDEGLAQAQQYGIAIIDACVEGGFTRVLCDEAELEYRLGIVDTYEDASFISTHAPKVARIAIVCNLKSVTNARFFEDVAVNRGLVLRFFLDRDAANDWLYA